MESPQLLDEVFRVGVFLRLQRRPCPRVLRIDHLVHLLEPHRVICALPVAATAARRTDRRRIERFFVVREMEVLARLVSVVMLIAFVAALVVLVEWDEPVLARMRHQPRAALRVLLQPVHRHVERNAAIVLAPVIVAARLRARRDEQPLAELLFIRIRNRLELLPCVPVQPFDLRLRTRVHVVIRAAHHVEASAARALLLLVGLVIRHDPRDVIRRLAVLRDMPVRLVVADVSRSCIVRRDRELDVSVIPVKKLPQILRTTAHVLRAIIRVDAEPRRRIRHQLHHAERPGRRHRRLVIAAFRRRDRREECRLDVFRLRRRRDLAVEPAVARERSTVAARHPAPRIRPPFVHCRLARAVPIIRPVRAIKPLHERQIIFRVLVLLQHPVQPCILLLVHARPVAHEDGKSVIHAVIRDERRHDARNERRIRLPQLRLHLLSAPSLLRPVGVHVPLHVAHRERQRLRVPRIHRRILRRLIQRDAVVLVDELLALAHLFRRRDALEVHRVLVVVAEQEPLDAPVVLRAFLLVRLLHELRHAVRQPRRILADARLKEPAFAVHAVHDFRADVVLRLHRAHVVRFILLLLRDLDHLSEPRREAVPFLPVRAERHRVARRLHGRRIHDIPPDRRLIRTELHLTHLTTANGSCHTASPGRTNAP